MTVSRHILYPARLWFILLTLLLALTANLLPSVGGKLRWLPDWLLLVLLYWGLYQPRRVGFSVVFVCGLIMDVAAGQWLGQHALAYVIALFLLLLWQRRLLMLTLWQQALHVGGLLLLASVLIAALRLFADGFFPGFGWFISPALGMLIWPFLALLMQWPQRHAPTSSL